MIFFSLLFSSMGCFFGYKLVKLYSAICGAIVGLISGITIGSALGSGFLTLVLGLGLAACCAILGYKVYKIGLFIITFFTAFFLVCILSLASAISNLSLSLILNYKQAISGTLGLSFIIALVAGLVAVVLAKPFIIISTGLCDGLLSGLFLATLFGMPKAAILFIPGFVIGGILFQIKDNHGLLESTENAYKQQMMTNQAPYGYGQMYGQPNQYVPQGGMQYGQANQYAPQVGMQFGQTNQYAPQAGMQYGQANQYAPQAGMQYGQANQYAPQVGMQYGQANQYAQRAGMQYGQANQYQQPAYSPRIPAPQQPGYYGTRQPVPRQAGQGVSPFQRR